jgi:hypothetical protein
MLYWPDVALVGFSTSSELVVLPTFAKKTPSSP